MASTWDAGSWGGANNWWEDKGGDAAATDAAAAGTAWQADPWAQAGSAPATTEEAAPAADPWSSGGGGWGNSGGQAAEEWVAKPPSADAFWEHQKWAQESNDRGQKDEWEYERDDVELFQERLGNAAGIDFQRYDNVPVDISGEKANVIPVCTSFEQMYEIFRELIPETLVNNVRRCRYATPTPVQKYAIPAGLAGRDVMCCAQTGSGKTAAFLVPAIGRMMQTNLNPTGSRQEAYSGACSPNTLVMTPTRELCIQIFEEAQKFCHRTNYRVARVYGGEAAKTQMGQICYGADLLVATPGRLNDFIGRGCVKVEEVAILVMDEADRMLDMGFEPQIREIVETHGMPTKENRQTMMFSATFPEDCQKMAADYLYNYIWIGVGVVGGAVDTVEQKIERVDPKKKFERLVEELDRFYEEKTKGDRCMVFVNAKDTARFLDEQLYGNNMDTGAIHGDLDQTQRETNLGRFRKGQIDVLICTDVAARGIDVADVKVVINYDMPQQMDTYVHRIGRSGRIGNKGTAITFLACEDEDCYEASENLKKLLQCMRDSGSEIPEWLEPLVDRSAEGRGGGGGWKWGGKDYRSNQESYSFNANADWSNWKKSDGDDAWKKSDGDDAGKDAWQSSTWGNGGGNSGGW